MRPFAAQTSEKVYQSGLESQHGARGAAQLKLSLSFSEYCGTAKKDSSSRTSYSLRPAAHSTAPDPFDPNSVVGGRWRRGKASQIAPISFGAKLGK